MNDLIIYDIGTMENFIQNLKTIKILRFYAKHIFQIH